MVVQTVTLSLELGLGAITLFLIFYSVRRAKPVPKGLRLPPGPRGKPFIGNVFDMPSHCEWETYAKWGKEYGDLTYIKAMGLSMVLVSSADVARDLFDTRSSIYSDRPHFPMLTDLIGSGWNFGVMPYGPRWRQYRRAFHDHFNPKAAVSFYDIQVKHTGNLLRNLHETPLEFASHLRHLASATIIEIVYGFKVLPTGDPYIEAGEKSLKVVVEVGNPGTYLVDTLPILKHVPEWMPGAGFRRKARIWRAMMHESVALPFLAVKEALSVGTAQPSVVSSLLNYTNQNNSSYTEEMIRDVAGAAYLAGADTLVSALSNFILAMVLYPEVQRKAQVELDSMIGMDRLPSFRDRENLPYVDAMCKEVYRWRPIVPLAIAHQVTQDDVYGDYFIPGGSIVIGNSWAILHDERTYGPETGEFRPERFLQSDITDPAAVFGFGRRMCPGRHMADNSFFIAVTSILKVFKISLATDEHGEQIPVEPASTSGLVSYPAPFKCAIKPRSASTEALLLQCTEN